MLKDWEFTVHARSMMLERGITEAWVFRTLSEPDRMEEQEDGTIHYLKRISENRGKVLRVVVNREVAPPRVVTQFFDRRERGAK